MVELQMVCPQAHVEALCDELEALQSASVSLEDADLDSDAEQALFGEPGLPLPVPAWRRSRVAALFTDDATAQVALALLKAQPWAAECVFADVRELPEQDWVRLTQSQFEPVAITPGFWIVPTWHEIPAAAKKVLRLDPGLAFGTGTHPTTRMCLRWIATRDPFASRRVLDYGCGSGVLALAAVLHGAGEVDAVDIDAAAVQAARLNALANQLPLNCGLPDMAHGAYDLVLANILATPLRLLAPVLCAHARVGAALVLSGILERQADEMERAYRPYAHLSVSDTEDGWILMTAVVTSSATLPRVAKHR